MAPKKKQIRNKKVVNKKASINRKAPNRDKKNFNNLSLVFTKVISTILAKPFFLVNLVINRLLVIVKNIFLQLFNLIKQTLKLLLKAREAFFSILFGLLAGGIGAVAIFSYLDLSSQGQNVEYETKILESEKVISSLQLELKKNNAKFEEFKNTISVLKNKLDATEKNSLKNKNFINEQNIKLEELFTKTNQTSEKILSAEEKNNNKIVELEQKIQNTSKLMLSSSKSELSDRLYLAKSLVDRLKSGVPYAPQLVALGQEGLDPALLRFAKGGAPTLSDLAARLSARAGELRDSMKTKSDSTWKDSLKDEIAKLVKVKPTNSENIKGMEGVLLRAEEAISKGNLEKAITEIDTLEINARGVLDAWLKEAKAKKDASIAAENILAKTTAALKIKN
ncbi:hypothetical protein N9V56_00395 [Alphaproteobacteria bacterium]|nr:hypothetical protein [Alphaproteobacteria bacterium]